MARPFQPFTNDELTTMLGRYKTQLINEGEDAVVTWHDGMHGETTNPVPITRQIQNVVDEMELRGMPLPGDGYQVADSAKGVL